MEHDDTKNNGSFRFLAGLVIGSLAGVAIGMLLAPHSGPVTRRKIMRSAGEAKDQVAEVLDDLGETSKGLLHEVKRVKKG